ncbi:hypothetical protein HYY75_00575 [bacterium]|nr:hypothetical protein [bacterium]
MEPSLLETMKDFGYSSEMQNLIASETAYQPSKFYLHQEKQKFETSRSIELPSPSVVIASQDVFLSPRVYQQPESATFLPTLFDLYKKQPQSPKITRKLALTCLEAGQTREALLWFIQTFQLDRHDLGALWNSAVLSHQLNDKKASKAFFTEYISIDPYSPWGKAAKRFLTNEPYNADQNLTQEFDSVQPKFGYSQTPKSETPQGSGLLVVGERALRVENLVASANVLPVQNPLNPTHPSSSSYQSKEGSEVEDEAIPVEAPPKSSGEVGSSSAPIEDSKKPPINQAIIKEIKTPQGNPTATTLASSSFIATFSGFVPRTISPELPPFVPPPPPASSP